MKPGGRERALYALQTIADAIARTMGALADDWRNQVWMRWTRRVRGGGNGWRPFEIKALTLPDGRGTGLTLWDVETNQPIGWPEWGEVTQGRLQVFPVLGAAKHYRFALQLADFAPGSQLSLVRETTGPHGAGTVAVFDATGKHRVGYIPRQYREPVGRALNRGSNAFVVWEMIQNRERVGLRIGLVAPAFLERFTRISAELESSTTDETAPVRSGEEVERERATGPRQGHVT